MSSLNKIDGLVSHHPGSKPLFLRHLPFRIILPVAVTIVLFILTIFLFLIPLLEENMLDAKRKGMMHLTESAWSSLGVFYARVQSGELSDEQARQKAISHLQQLRYGPEFEDYFWINDMTPKMIMHPYRPDLVGRDVSAFKDPSGKPLFVEMVAMVKAQKQGFVDYLWQWKGDSSKIVPKISYVKGFDPWGWVIGTGIYVDDVHQEILAITRQLTYTCFGIMMLFLLISSYIIWQGAKGEKERIKAMEESRMREKQLIQADKMASLGVLVAGVAHEVNNPVTSIMLSAPSLKKAWSAFTPVLDGYYKYKKDQQVCNMPYEDLSQRVRSMLTAIEDSAGRIKNIITDLKDFSQPQQSTDADQNMNHQVDIGQIVNKSLDLTHTILKKATRHLSCDIEEHLPRVKGNSQKLQQVVINLLVNAAQALDHVDQKISITGRCSKDGRWVEVQVKDSGPGVTGEMIKRIKDPFFTTRRDEGGTGLGLSISDKIISDHGGRLEFEPNIHSENSSGLTATIILPAILPPLSEQLQENKDGR